MPTPDLVLATKPERASYTIGDFREWRQTDKLVLSPKFQRRAVWSLQAKSFLIDTVLRGMPIPPIYLRLTQDPSFKGPKREVVDGQQRVRACLDFTDDKFAISKSIDSPIAGKFFSKLPLEAQERLASYTFSCEVWRGVSDEVVLDIFARLNTYSTKLNNQELRNGKYFGHFRSSATRVARQFFEFWSASKLFTTQKIARMAEVELVSELLIIHMDGMQDKKKSINDFYKDYDAEFPGQKTFEAAVARTLGFFAEHLTDTISDTVFRRSVMFYSLYCAVASLAFGTPDGPASSSKVRFGKEFASSVSSAMYEIDDVLMDDDATLSPKLGDHKEFLEACKRQTDNIRPRNIRFQVIREAIARAR
ncbi:MAG: DUF262 domain-containing protein [Phycisphaerales bacterium]